MTTAARWICWRSSGNSTTIGSRSSCFSDTTCANVSASVRDACRRHRILTIMSSPHTLPGTKIHPHRAIAPLFTMHSRPTNLLHSSRRSKRQGSIFSLTRMVNSSPHPVARYHTRAIHRWARNMARSPRSWAPKDSAMARDRRRASWYRASRMYSRSRRARDTGTPCSFTIAFSASMRCSKACRGGSRADTIEQAQPIMYAQTIAPLYINSTHSTYSGKEAGTTSPYPMLVMDMTAKCRAAL
mmetsp:Transcript_92274/g.246744  ORF Transcript_92274/g.246744 Transcript_92274/m.246744 type:complete len:242 (-) Transcript_92274:44-769(-)